MLQKTKLFILLSLSCFVFTNFLGAMVEEDSWGLRTLFEETIEPPQIQNPEPLPLPNTESIQTPMSSKGSRESDSPGIPTTPIACSRGAMIVQHCPPLLWNLYEAVLHRDLATIESLATNPRIPINYPIDDRGNSLLHLTLKSQHLEEDPRILESIITILLQNKSIYLVATNSSEETPLHVAIKEDLVSCAVLVANAMARCEQLLSNIQDSEMNTALHLAVTQNMVPAVAAILTIPRINVNLLNERNQTPLDIVEEFGLEGLIGPLRAHGARTANELMPSLQLPTHGHRRQPSSLDGEVFPFDRDEPSAAPASAPGELQHRQAQFPDMESGYGILGT